MSEYSSEINWRFLFRSAKLKTKFKSFCNYFSHLSLNTKRNITSLKSPKGYSRRCSVRTPTFRQLLWVQRNDWREICMSMYTNMYTIDEKYVYVYQDIFKRISLVQLANFRNFYIYMALIYQKILISWIRIWNQEVPLLTEGPEWPNMFSNFK